MATIARVPLEVYLQADEYEPDAEYVDGEIEERPMGQDDHSAWQVALTRWFSEHASQWKIRVRTELRVQTGASRFRVPDVAILDRAVPLSPIATHPPLAVFEVLSPEDRLQRLMRKLGDYVAMGVAQIWVIDPVTGVFSRWEDGQLVRRERFVDRERGIDFGVSEIAALVD